MSDFSRRTVVRGAAWTVPVVAVAAQAPAFAVSPPPPRRRSSTSPVPAETPETPGRAVGASSRSRSRSRWTTRRPTPSCSRSRPCSSARTASRPRGLAPAPSPGSAASAAPRASDADDNVHGTTQVAVDVHGRRGRRHPGQVRVRPSSVAANTTALLLDRVRRTPGLRTTSRRGSSTGCSTTATLRSRSAVDVRDVRHRRRSRPRTATARPIAPATLRPARARRQWQPSDGLRPWTVGLSRGLSAVQPRACDSGTRTHHSRPQKADASMHLPRAACTYRPARARDLPPGSGSPPEPPPPMEASRRRRVTHEPVGAGSSMPGAGVRAGCGTARQIGAGRLRPIR